MSFLRGNNIYSEVIASPEFNRLKDISFLGILGYSSSASNSYSTRYEHSIAVASKCLTYAHQKNFSESEENYFVLAGLLHDIGHCSFSHSLEPVFINKFSLSHHDVTNHLILHSPGLVKIWAQYDIDAKRTIDTIEGRISQRDRLITKMSINFDTLEGIARTEKQYSDADIAGDVCEQVFHIMCSNENWLNHIDVFDSFWEQKENVYSSYIYNDKLRIIELLFQDLFTHEEFLNIDHYFLTDSEIQNQFPWVSQFIHDIRNNNSLGIVYNELNKAKEYRDVVESSIRRFKIDFSEKFSVLKNQRYFVSEGSTSINLTNTI